MNDVFDKITLKWKGEEYFIDDDMQVMRLISKIEEIITVPELMIATDTGKIPMSSIAACYALALEQAGAKASWVEVYQSMFASTDDAQEQIGAIVLLVKMVLPKDIREKAEAEAAKEAEAEKSLGKKTPAAKNKRLPRKGKSKSR